MHQELITATAKHFAETDDIDYLSKMYHETAEDIYMHKVYAMAIKMQNGMYGIQLELEFKG